MSVKTAQFLQPSETPFPIVIITGVCRSGKTLLGNILATCNESEYADEPYGPMLLPFIAKSGKMEYDFAIRWMGAHLRELFNDLLLLRTANFRPNDLSSIWSKRDSKQILNRLLEINTRKEAAEFSKHNKSQLIVTLSECIPFLDFIKASAPTAKIIHVIRNPYDIASDIAQKKWYSDDQLISPQMAQPYTSYQFANTSWHIPWWVEDHEYDDFLKLTEYERGLYYWWSLMNQWLQIKASRDETLVQYEDLIQHPQKITEKLMTSLGLTAGTFTALKLSEIKNHPRDTNIPTIDPTIKKRINLIMEKLQ